jgi:hypothetical protein
LHKKEANSGQHVSLLPTSENAPPLFSSGFLNGLQSPWVCFSQQAFYFWNDADLKSLPLPPAKAAKPQPSATGKKE